MNSEGGWLYKIFVFFVCFVVKKKNSQRQDRDYLHIRVCNVQTEIRKT
jgi:hypothetical protein